MNSQNKESPGNKIGYFNLQKKNPQNNMESLNQNVIGGNYFILF